MTDVVLIHLAEHAIPAGPDSSRCFMSDLGNLAPDSKPVAVRIESGTAAVCRRGARQYKLAGLVVVFATVYSACEDTITSPQTRLRAGQPAFLEAFGPDSTRCTGEQQMRTFYWDGTNYQFCSQTFSIQEPAPDGRAKITETFRGPLHITFSVPVYHLVVEGQQGGYSCSGPTYGSVNATTVSGQTITIPFVNPLPEDCGEDDIACCLSAAIPTDSGITAVEITEMEPRSWTTQWGDAHSSMTYDVIFDRWPPCPPTGDSLLDNQRFRESLAAALQKSFADSVPLSIRREVGGWLYYDQNGILQAEFSTEPGSTPCSSIVTYNPTTVVGVFHVHPFTPANETTPGDVLPSNCGNQAGLEYDADTWGGPSNLDWQTSVNKGHPIYVIDKLRVYRTDPRVTDSLKWRDSTLRATWKTSCTWSKLH